MNPGEVVDWVAERLADPTRVRMLASDWNPASLAEGYAGIAVFYGSLPGHRQQAHAHLAAAVRERTDAGGGALFVGDLAIGFAAAVTARTREDYRGLRASVAVSARRALAQHDERRPFFHDTISGLTGLGRYLLATGDLPTLREVLTRLVALREDDWWVRRPPTDVDSPASFPDGHLNLGLAHGIAGPLALLSLATRAGIDVPGQAEAVRRLAEFLLAQASSDGHGPLWPHYLPRPAPVRPGWCYGGLGVARALQLAGIALGVPAWNEQAVRTVRAALSRDLWEYHDASLCHGAAGALRITTRIAQDSGDKVLRAALPELTERVLAYFDPSAPFGFRYPDAEFRLVVDRAGYLEGAAGIALALAETDQSLSTTWDSALLLA